MRYKNIFRKYKQIISAYLFGSRAKNTFIGDYHYYGLAERYLQLSIECILDAGHNQIFKKEEIYLKVSK